MAPCVRCFLFSVIMALFFSAATIARADAGESLGEERKLFAVGDYLPAADMARATGSAEGLAGQELARLQATDLASANFCWAGGQLRGEPHYYRVQSTSFLAEYDNTQNDANHIHAVWRDLTNDFGDDLLRRHYEQSH